MNSATQRCDRCASGYDITEDGFCAIFDPNCAEVVKGICQRCRANFHLDSTNFCQPNPKGCSLYDFFTKKCTKCMNMYLLLNG